jgi:cytochrome c oxidase subunit II
MIVQDEVWIITLVGVGLVALTFLLVIVQAGRPPAVDASPAKAYVLQRWWLLVLVVLGVAITAATLRPFPIPAQHTESSTAQIVKATGHQWSWELSQTHVTAGTPVEFDVTGADVNHGFAIYGLDDRILAQTQAMPGYTNRLRYTFTQPGTYHVMCLEYCGLGHHGMMATFEVVAAKHGGRP